MEPVLHIDLDKVLAGPKPVVLELGCGPNKQRRGYIGIDRLDLAGVDIVADLEEGLPFLPDNSVDRIYSISFLEHIQKLERLMGEIWRVLKPGGKNILFVPHFSNPYFYSDPTHTRFFGLYSFEYFSKSQPRFHRKVPAFYYDFSFRTVELKLRIGTATRNPIKWAAHLLFNLSPWWQELYEANFCYWVPCTGISATLEPEKEP